MQYMIADFRSDNLDRNLAKDPEHKTRCEMCWKPLYADKNQIKKVIVTCDLDLTLPNSESEIKADSPTIQIGSTCLRKLKKFSKEDGFIVKTK